MTTIDPRIRTANYDRYEILSTFNLARINQALGTNYTTHGEVFRAQAEAFALLTPAEQRQDEKVIRIALAPFGNVRS